MAYRFHWLTNWDAAGRSPARAVVATDARAARAAWIQRCERRLLELRPDVEPAQAALAASRLWTNANDMHPHDAAQMRSLTWIA